MFPDFYLAFFLRNYTGDFEVYQSFKLIILLRTYQAALKILKVEEKLSKGWGGENAYHVSGYRYLLVDGDRNVSRASPSGKVATLTKVKHPAIFHLGEKSFNIKTLFHIII